MPELLEIILIVFAKVTDVDAVDFGSLPYAIFRFRLNTYLTSQCNLHPLRPQVPINRTSIHTFLGPIPGSPILNGNRIRLHVHEHHISDGICEWAREVGCASASGAFELFHHAPS